jgi:hypothetical protein
MSIYYRMPSSYFILGQILRPVFVNRSCTLIYSLRQSRFSSHLDTTGSRFSKPSISEMAQLLMIRFDFEWGSGASHLFVSLSPIIWFSYSPRYVPASPPVPRKYPLLITKKARAADVESIGFKMYFAVPLTLVRSAITKSYIRISDLPVPAQKMVLSLVCHLCYSVLFMAQTAELTLRSSLKIHVYKLSSAVLKWRPTSRLIDKNDMCRSSAAFWMGGFHVR